MVCLSPKAARVLFAAALLVVFVLSLLPVPEGLMVFRWQDKLEHAMAFAVLALLASMAQAGSRLVQVVGLLAYGALIELAQGMTSYRMADPADWLADAFGVGLVTLLVLGWKRRRG